MTEIKKCTVVFLKILKQKIGYSNHPHNDRYGILVFKFTIEDKIYKM